MREVEHVRVEDAPAPQGAYSQVVRAGDFLFVSGQGPTDSETQQFVFSVLRRTRPARTTVQATLVEEGMKVEIDCVAYLPAK